MNDLETCRVCERKMSKFQFIQHIKVCIKIQKKKLKICEKTDLLLLLIKNFEAERRFFESKYIHKTKNKSSKLPNENQNPLIVKLRELAVLDKNLKGNKKHHVSRDNKKNHKILNSIRRKIRVLDRNLRVDPFSLLEDIKIKYSLSQATKRLNGESISKIVEYLEKMLDIIEKRIANIEILKKRKKKDVIDQSNNQILDRIRSHTANRFSSIHMGTGNLFSLRSTTDLMNVDVITRRSTILHLMDIKEVSIKKGNRNEESDNISLDSYQSEKEDYEFFSNTKNLKNNKKNFEKNNIKFQKNSLLKRKDSMHPILELKQMEQEETTLEQISSTDSLIQLSNIGIKSFSKSLRNMGDSSDINHLSPNKVYPLKKNKSVKVEKLKIDSQHDSTLKVPAMSPTHRSTPTISDASPKSSYLEEDSYDSDDEMIEEQEEIVSAKKKFQRAVKRLKMMNNQLTTGNLSMGHSLGYSNYSIKTQKSDISSASNKIFVIGNKLKQKDPTQTSGQILHHQEHHKNPKNNFLNLNDVERLTVSDPGYYFKDVQLQASAFDFSKVTASDFEYLRTLGKGAYGKVFLVRKKSTKDIYALKVISCKKELTHSYIQNLLNERNIFGMLDTRFTVNAVSTFLYKNFVCFVLDYMPGGDLRHLLDREEYFDENWTRFYISEIIVALEHLHQANIIHRDIKPENVLIGSDGHIKLADFGLSQIKEKLEFQKFDISQKPSDIIENLRNKKNKVSDNGSPNLAREKKLTESFISTTQESSSKNDSNVFKAQLIPIAEKPQSIKQQRIRIIGTPDYIAPEIIKGEKYGPEVDWWSVGCIIYELLVNFPPFNDNSVKKIFKNIVELKLDWPPIAKEGEVNYEEEGKMGLEIHSLITSFLERDPKKRLGYNGISEIKGHKFFKNVEWEKVGKIEPYWIPSPSRISQLKKEKGKSLTTHFLQAFGLESGDLSKKSSRLPFTSRFEFMRHDLFHRRNLDAKVKIFEENKKFIEREKELKLLLKKLSYDNDLYFFSQISDFE